MNINGKVKISNKWVDKQIDKSQFDFDNRGNIAFGSLNWTDVKKGKNGAKDEFTTTTKRFATFNSDVMNLIQSSLGEFLEIKGKLVGNSYIDKEGKKKNQEQIIIDEAELFVKEISQHSKDKGNGYQQQAEDSEENDSMIPF
jgi:hypothetical protein